MTVTLEPEHRHGTSATSMLTEVIRDRQPGFPMRSGSGHGLRGLYSAPTIEGQILRSRIARDANLELKATIRPSIKFQQDFDARVEREAKARESKPMPALPDGFPAKIEGKRIWHGNDIRSVEDFMIRFSEEQVEEISAALRYFVTRKLEEISNDLHSGRGMVLLRGIAPSRFTPRENVLLIAGITSYIGDQRGCQDRFGNMITHLVDMGFMFGKGSKRTPAFTRGALPYHNDVCDILAMYVQESARGGGESLLASSAAVYNEIAATRPDLIKVLTDPVWIYDKDVLPSVWNGRPILFPEPTHGPFFCYSRQKITGSEHYPLSASLPAMSEAQAEALDLVHYVAESQGLAVALDPGDILLNNNLSVMHGRRAFNDAPANGQRRHIMRLWMRSDKQAWKTPPELEQEWHRVYGDSERRSCACWKIRPEDTELDRVIGHMMTCS